MGHEAEERIGSSPLGIMLEADGGEDRQPVDDTTQPTAKDESREVCSDGLPLVVVRIRQASQR